MVTVNSIELRPSTSVLQQVLFFFLVKSETKLKVSITIMDSRRRLEQLKLKRKEALKANESHIKEERSNQRQRSIGLKRHSDDQSDDQSQETAPITEKDRILNYTVEQTDKWHDQQKTKKKTSENFSELAALTYDKEVDNLNIDKVKYNQEKQKVIDKYQVLDPGKLNTTLELIQNSPDKAASKELANSIRQLDQERYHRKRTRHDEDGANYINDKNKQFNKKLDRQYKD